MAFPRGLIRSKRMLPACMQHSRWESARHIFNVSVEMNVAAVTSTINVTASDTAQGEESAQHTPSASPSWRKPQT